MTPGMVIFDCDGVLVDSEPITNQLLRDDLAERGLDLTLDQVLLAFVGGTIKGAAEHAAAQGADIPDDWVPNFYQKAFDKLAEGTPLITGAVDILQRLDQANIPYAVGSNGPERKMEITLGSYPEMWGRLQGKIYSAHTYKAAKPDPTIYLAAAKDAGIDPKDCIVIDDSPSGCTAGIRAGMQVLGLAEHDDGARLQAVGATVVHSLAEAADKIGV